MKPSTDPRIPDWVVALAGLVILALVALSHAGCGPSKATLRSELAKARDQRDRSVALNQKLQSGFLDPNSDEAYLELRGLELEVEADDMIRLRERLSAWERARPYLLRYGKRAVPAVLSWAAAQVPVIGWLVGILAPSDGSGPETEGVLP